MLVVCIVPSDDSDIPLPDVPEDTLATGVPLFMLSTANLAESVDTPPSRRSNDWFLGCIVPRSSWNGPTCD